MATRNTDIDKKTSAGQKKPAAPDALVKGGKTKNELTEDELKDVSGGPIYVNYNNYKE